MAARHPLWQYVITYGTRSLFVPVQKRRYRRDPEAVAILGAALGFFVSFGRIVGLRVLFHLQHLLKSGLLLRCGGVRRELSRVIRHCAIVRDRKRVHYRGHRGHDAFKIFRK